MNKKMEWKIGTIDEISTFDLYKALQLRCEVFVVEQKRIVGEIDGKDIDSRMIHILALKARAVVGYARISPPGLTYSEVSIERVVVAQNERGKGLGRLLMDKIVETVMTEYADRPVKIHAQRYLEKFYCSYHFHRIGEPFDEGGIEHVFLVNDSEFWKRNSKPKAFRP